jgi:3-oxoadipate enol-lactonase
VRPLTTLRDGAVIAHEVQGQEHAGVPVLLVRPLGGTIALWGLFRDLLAKHFRVISFDYRGAGQPNAQAALRSTRGFARDALDVLDGLQVEQAHVFGISLGGMVATWLAADAPARVRRLCLASTAARGLELSHASLRRELSLVACFAKPRDEVEVSMVDRILSARFRQAQPEACQQIEALVRARRTSRLSLVEHALAGLLHDARGVLSSIGAPTLVLAGERDALVGTEAPRELARALPHATFEVIADAGHDVTLEQPVVTAARVSAFFEAREDSRGDGG